MRFINFHAPDEVRVFQVAPEGIRRCDDRAMVYDVRVGENRVLRHYSFPDRWFEINCSLDLDGRFINEPCAYGWSFNCDISTPHFMIGSDLYNMDLWIDVLVGSDGRRIAVVKDEDEFEAAVRQRHLTDLERVGARKGLADLLAICRDRGLVDFLERVCPFDTVSAKTPQPPMVVRPLAEFPMLAATARHRYFGQRLAQPVE